MNNKILFSYQQSCGISAETLLKIKQQHTFYAIEQKIKKEIADFKEYKTPYASLGLPFDQEMQTNIQNRVHEKQKLNPSLIVVVGIGGSSLGTKAVFQAVLSCYQQNDLKEMIFVETVDSDYLKRVLIKLEKELAQSHPIIVNVVTKSGTTVETLMNFEIILALVKKYRPFDYQKLIVVTTDAGSPLCALALKEQFALLEIPKVVGGRFSVFSAVGLFPLALAGVNVQALCTGAQDFTQNENDFENPAALSALIQWHHYQQGMNISNLFLFSLDLEDLGKWYRQLFAESLGKEVDCDGFEKVINLIPIVSVGSVDLHSVVQLYLSSAKTMTTTFVSVKPQYDYYDNQMEILVQATKAAYTKKNRPFCSIVLSEKNEYSIGQFLQCNMMEVMYLGLLWNINAFDQPHVELYKQEMKNIKTRNMV